MKKIHVCTTCGSPRVTWDALVHPNRGETTLLDSSDCEDCDGQCNTQEVEVADDFDIDTDFYKE